MRAIRRDLTVIVIVLFAFVMLDLRFGFEARSLLQWSAIGFAFALCIGILTAAYRPRGSR